MIFSKKDLYRALINWKFRIDSDLDPNQISYASIDLRLGYKYSKQKKGLNLKNLQLLMRGIVLPRRDVVNRS